MIVYIWNCDLVKVRHACACDNIPHVQATHMRQRYVKYYFLPPPKMYEKKGIYVVPIVEVPDLKDQTHPTINVVHKNVNMRRALVMY